MSSFAKNFTSNVESAMCVRDYSWEVGGGRFFDAVAYSQLHVHMYCMWLI